MGHTFRKDDDERYGQNRRHAERPIPEPAVTPDIPQHLVTDIQYLGHQGVWHLWAGVDVDDEEVAVVVHDGHATAFCREVILAEDRTGDVEFRMAWQAAYRAGWLTA